MTQPVQTPLGINALAGLVQNTGLVPNVLWRNFVGTSIGLGNYTAGSFVTGYPLYAKVLSILNSAASLIGNNIVSDVSTTTYNNLVNLGSALPALALSSANLVDYEFTCSSTTSTGIITVSSTAYFNVGDPVYFTGTLDPAIASGAVYWVQSIISATQFSISTTPAGPVLPLTGGSFAMQVVSVVFLQNSWIGKLATQGYFSWGTGLPDFLGYFSFASSFCAQQNPVITSTANSTNFLQGAYSNINDLITGDVSGICLSLPQFGQDLIAQGRALSLSTIQSFGLPSNLLQTLSANRAQTDAVNLALLSTDLTTQEIRGFNSDPENITTAQQRKIYSAFQLIRNVDLAEVCILLNCRLQNLESLADLLDPKKLFPLSYAALTVPIWNTTAGPTNSKTYYLIYVNNGVNTQLSGNNIRAQVGYKVPANITAAALHDPNTPEFRELVPGFDSYLRDILPPDIATACGALSYSFMQISNVESQDIQKFAQVVANLEVAKDLPDVGGTDVPVNSNAATTALSAIGLGSGPNGTYTMADFFGSITGTCYTLQQLPDLITQFDITNLDTIYTQMQSILAAPPTVAGYNSDLAPLITAANTEIQIISTVNSTLTANVNSIWSTAVNALRIEIAARIRAFTSFDVADVSVSPDSQISWINQLQQWSLETEPNMSAQTIEQLCDTTTLTGQSIIGLMRQIRNTARLNLLGIPNYAEIPGTQTLQQQSNLIANNPANTAAKALGKLENDKYLVTDTQYQSPRVVLDGSAVEGSFGGSPYQELIPPQLNSLYTSAQLKSSTYSVPEAVTEVERCNCTCWNP